MNDHATDCYDAMLCQLMCQPIKVLYSILPTLSSRLDIILKPLILLYVYTTIGVQIHFIGKFACRKTLALCYRSLRAFFSPQKCKIMQFEMVLYILLKICSLKMINILVENI